MTRVALGDLRAHPVRLLATALSVVLGTAFVAGTFILTDMARAAFDHLFAAGGAHADVVVRSVGDLEGQVREGAAVPDRVVDAVAAVDGVAAVAAVHEGPALLLGPDGEPLDGPGFGGPPSAVSWIAEDALRDQVLRTGRAPAGAGEIAVADAIAADQGLALGDEVRLVFGNAVVDARVVGTFSYDEGGGGGTDVGTLGGRPSVALDAGAAAEHPAAPPRCGCSPPTASATPAALTNPPASRCWGAQRSAGTPVAGPHRSSGR